MKKFEIISPKENRPKSSPRETLSQEGLARRNVLKGLATAAAITTVGPKIIELAKNIDIPHALVTHLDLSLRDIMRVSRKS